MKAPFATFAAYNAWANARLYASLAPVPPEDLARDLGAFFGSILVTLNHVMVADLIWLARFRGQRPPPFALDHVLHDDLAELSAARRVLDADVAAYVDGLDAAALAGRFAYLRASTGERLEEPLMPALAHLFNHQTHHRGQAHAMLTRLGHRAPALDLIYFAREAG
ncbi:MAG: DinB family protein [Paracoccaceae bacterium]